MRLPMQIASVLRRERSAAIRSGGGVVAQDTCITVSYDNGKICANFPYIGQYCVTVPGLPSGSGSAKACVSYKFPDCGVICVSIGSLKLPCITQCLT